MAYKLPNLPYANDALEPHIDAQTMSIHHDKHHNAYVTKLNAAIEGTDLGNQSIEDLIKNLESVPENIRGAVRNNGGGHANHSLFWTVMSADGGGQPSGDLAAAIDAELGGFDAFKRSIQQRGSNTIRQRLGMALSRWRWQTCRRKHAEPRFATNLRQQTYLRFRRLGNMLTT